MSQPVFSRFDTVVLKDKSATDKAQIPAFNVTVAFYNQGATVSASNYVPVTAGQPDPIPTAVAVYDSGTLAVGDLLQVGVLSNEVMWVHSVVDLKTVMVLNNTAYDIALNVGDRLVRTTNRPTVYSDPLCTVSAGSQVLTDSAGRARAYLKAPRFDYILSGGGLSVVRLFVDVIGGMAPSPSWINSSDQSSLQAAIDALPPTGGEITLPAKTIVLSSRLEVNKQGVTIRGLGPSATVITGPLNPSFDLVRVTQPNCRLLDLKIDGNTNLVAPGGSCLVLEGSAVRQCHLQNILLSGACSYGLLLKNMSSILAMNIESSSNRLSGIKVERTDQTPWCIQVLGGTFRNNYLHGIEVAPTTLYYGDTVSILGASLIGNDIGGGLAVKLTGVRGIKLVGCYFEWNRPLGSGEFIVGTDAQVSVEGCWFEGLGQGATLPMWRAARFVNSPAVVFTNNVGHNLELDLVRFQGADKSVEFGNRELPETGNPPRIIVESGSRVFSLSKGVVEIYS